MVPQDYASQNVISFAWDIFLFTFSECNLQLSPDICFSLCLFTSSSVSSPSSAEVKNAWSRTSIPHTSSWRSTYLSTGATLPLSLQNIAKYVTWNCRERIGNCVLRHFHILLLSDTNRLSYWSMSYIGTGAEVHRPWWIMERVCVCGCQVRGVSIVKIWKCGPLVA